MEVCTINAFTPTKHRQKTTQTKATKDSGIHVFFGLLKRMSQKDEQSQGLRHLQLSDCPMRLWRGRLNRLYVLSPGAATQTSSIYWSRVLVTWITWPDW